VETRADFVTFKSMYPSYLHSIQSYHINQTLDALPAHLLTPFNGPIPPSNLLDKIARGVANAKGPNDWPHTVRATRVKLMEIARQLAKTSIRDENRRRCPTEEEDYAYFGFGGEVLQPSTNTVSRRPIRRQSSMDFMNPAKTELKDNNNIAR
jgi:transcription factor SPN1